MNYWVIIHLRNPAFSILELQDLRICDAWKHAKQTYVPNEQKYAKRCFFLLDGIANHYLKNHASPFWWVTGILTACDHLRLGGSWDAGCPCPTMRVYYHQDDASRGEKKIKPPARFNQPLQLPAGGVHHPNLLHKSLPCATLSP